MRGSAPEVQLPPALPPAHPVDAPPLAFPPANGEPTVPLKLSDTRVIPASPPAEPPPEPDADSSPEPNPDLRPDAEPELRPDAVPADGADA